MAGGGACSWMGEEKERGDLCTLWRWLDREISQEKKRGSGKIGGALPGKDWEKGGGSGLRARFSAVGVLYQRGKEVGLVR